MNNTAKELSNISKRFFDGENITREKGSEGFVDTTMFGIKKSNRREIQRDIKDQGDMKAWENFEERFGRKLTNEERKILLRHIFEYKNYDSLIDIREEFKIKLFKALSIGSNSFEVSPESFEILDKKRLLVKDQDKIYSYLIMHPGDVEINVDEPTLSKNIRKFKSRNKRVAKVIVKGENCFLQTTDAAFIIGDLTRLELATQEDIKTVFEELNKML